MSTTAKRIAVTGAAGFVGSHLTESLRAQGHEVFRVVRTASGASADAKADPKIHTVDIDSVLTNPGRAFGDAPLDALVHAAAVRHRHAVDASTYRASNVTLLERLAAALEGRIGRFVLVSSVGVYGFPAELPISEKTPFAPKTLYSATKVHAERAMVMLAKRHRFEFVIARPTITYGRGDTNGMLDKMAAMIEHHRYLLVGRGENTLHHTYIDDLVQGLTLAALSPAAKNDDFIFAGPETTTLAQLSKRVAEAMGTNLPPVHVPLALARAVATAVDVAAYRGWAFSEREPPINHEKLDVMTVPIAFDASKAKRVLGYSPQVGYQEGIRRTLSVR